MPLRRRPTAPFATPLDLWVVGHTNLDHFLYVRSLPGRDRTVPIVRRETHLGGTGANLALSAASWGVRTGLVSRVGPDFPDEFRERLRAAGVDLRGLTVDPVLPSSACFITEDGRGGQSTLIDQGPMRDGTRYDGPRDIFGEAPWAHLTTAAPAYLLEAKAEVRRAGGRVAVDPAQEIHYRWDGPGLRELLAGAEILFGNDHEIARAVELLGLDKVSGLLEHVPLVVRTEGARGATAVSRVGTVHVPAPRVATVRQVTGAGDAFRGGFYAGWFEGLPLVGCLTAGVRSAARWVARGPPRPRGRRGSRARGVRR